mgnify:CR=1 FL=1
MGQESAIHDSDACVRPTNDFASESDCKSNSSCWKHVLLSVPCSTCSTGLLLPESKHSGFAGGAHVKEIVVLAVTGVNLELCYLCGPPLVFTACHRCLF